MLITRRFSQTNGMKNTEEYEADSTGGQTT